jgi:hypothetical protein
MNRTRKLQEAVNRATSHVEPAVEDSLKDVQDVFFTKVRSTREKQFHFATQITRERVRPYGWVPITAEAGMGSKKSIF